MKKILAFLFLTVVALSSCKKSCEEIQRDHIDLGDEYFEFGYAGGFAGGREHYVISNGQLFKDSISSTALSTAKLNTAKVLIEHFPALLLSNTNKTYGCRGCADQITIELRRRISGVVYYWYLDMIVSDLPIELHGYVQEVYDVTRQL